jgi:hypothetical protein
MKRILVELSNEEYQALVAAKGKDTWRGVLFKGSRVKPPLNRRLPPVVYHYEALEFVREWKRRGLWGYLDEEILKMRQTHQLTEAKRNLFK